MSNIYDLRGISTTFLTSLGRVRLSDNVNKLEEDFKTLLETRKGTLIGDPAFGSNLVDLLFEPASESLANEMRIEIANTLESYYTNISITNIDVVFSDVSVRLAISYKVFNSNINDTVMLEFLTGNTN